MEAGAGATTTRAIASTSEGQERARRFATKVAATRGAASLRDTGHVHDAPTAYQNADRPVLTSLFESIRRFVRLRRRALVWDLGHLLATPTRARPLRAERSHLRFAEFHVSRTRANAASSPRNLAAESRRRIPSPHPVGSAMDAEHHDDRGAGHPPPLPPNPYPYDDHGAGGVGSKRGRSPSRYPPGDPGYDDDRRRSPQRSPASSIRRPAPGRSPRPSRPRRSPRPPLQRRRRGLIFPRVLPPAHVRPRHPLGVRARVRAVQSQQRGKLPQARFSRPRRREDEGGARSAKDPLPRPRARRRRRRRRRVHRGGRRGNPRPLSLPPREPPGEVAARVAARWARCEAAEGPPSAPRRARTLARPRSGVEPHARGARFAPVRQTRRGGGRRALGGPGGGSIR